MTATSPQLHCSPARPCERKRNKETADAKLFCCKNYIENKYQLHVDFTS